MANAQSEEQFNISQRAQCTLSSTTPFFKYVQQVLGDSYDPVDNSDGIVNFGIAENKICEDLIMSKIKTLQGKDESSKLLYYDVNSGNAELKETGKKFLENYFDPLEDIDAGNVVIVSGVTASLETLAYAVADRGEYIIVPSPFYFRIEKDVKERAEVNVLSVPLQYKDDSLPSECIFSSEMLEEAFQNAKKEGKIVKAILLSSPNNPSGDVFSREQLLDILQFAYRNKLHVISNEIYALSVFNLEVKFTSILSVPHPDPNMVHVTWGCSKDLGLAGYKFAIQYTRNPKVLAYCLSSAVFTTVSSIVGFRLKEILNDTDWLNNVFLPTKHCRMLERYNKICTLLKDHGVKVHNSAATMFIWIDLTELLPEQTFEAEDALFLKFLAEKVFIQPGYQVFNKTPGMFRMVFTLDEDINEEGVKRMLNVLKSSPRYPHPRGNSTSY
uniref:Aminotransferase class I/classII large domain-containing protein n=2 Tax=Biomphalaria glabrata TaxID=6526 RepID=A0A2C9K618_BIOGL